MSAVTSPARVTYRCQRSGNTWTVGTFDVELTATAGPAGCSSQVTRATTVRIMLALKPVVTFATPPPPVADCTDSAVNYVGMTYRVQTASGNLLSVPPTATTSDGRVCELQGPSSKCE
jgi:hypothetical protein